MALLSFGAFFLAELGNTISSLFGGGTTADTKENGTDAVQVRPAWSQGSSGEGLCAPGVAAEAGIGVGFPAAWDWLDYPFPCPVNHTILWTPGGPCARNPGHISLLSKPLSFVRLGHRCHPVVCLPPHCAGRRKPRGRDLAGP